MGKIFRVCTKMGLGVAPRCARVHIFSYRMGKKCVFAHFVHRYRIDLFNLVGLATGGCNRENVQNVPKIFNTNITILHPKKHDKIFYPVFSQKMGLEVYMCHQIFGGF